MAIGGTRYFSYAFWLALKQLRTVLRREQLSLLAGFLSTAVLVRERAELVQVFQGIWPGNAGLIIIISALLTLMAAIWRIAGNLRPSQEVRFVIAMRVLLSEVGKFSYGKDREFDVARRLDHFVELFLEVTSSVLGGGRNIVAALMVPKRDALAVIKQSKTANYQSQSKTSHQAQDESTGLSAISFRDQKIVYMPSRRRELSLSFEFTEGHYVPSSPVSEPTISVTEHESYNSVLCLPIASYENRYEKIPFGVLSFSSNTTDAFVERDFIMGECFSSILAHVFRISKADAIRDPFTREKSSPDDETIDDPTSETQGGRLHLNGRGGLVVARKTLY